MPILDQLQSGAGNANNAVTTAGGADAFRQAVIADRLIDSQRLSRTASMGKVPDLPGGKAVGWAGGALSLLGFGTDLYDMSQNGVGVDNSVSASGNLAGVGSAALSGTPLGAMLAGYSAGTTLGQAGNRWTESNGILGERDREYESRGNRNWSDLSADAGRWARDGIGGTAGDIAGGLTTGVTSALMTPAIAASGLASGAETVGRMISRRNEPLLEGIGPQIAAARATANDNR